MLDELAEMVRLRRLLLRELADTEIVDREKRTSVKVMIRSRETRGR